MPSGLRSSPSSRSRSITIRSAAIDRGRRSGLLRGDARPPGDGLLVGGRRAALREQGLRHHGARSDVTSGSTAGRVRRHRRRGDRRLRQDHRSRSLRRRRRRIIAQKPLWGEGTGKNPTDRAKLGWKWSILTDSNGIPIGWAIDGANRNDSVLLAPTLDDAAERGLLAEIETLWLDRGYDSDVDPRRVLRHAGSTTPSSPRSARRGQPARPRRTNRWDCAGRSNAPTRGSRTSAAAAEHRSQDHSPPRSVRPGRRFLLTAKLIDWRNRWSPDLVPIR